MKKLLLILILTPFMVLSQDNNLAKDIEDATKTAQKFLNQVDEKKYEAAWQNADDLIQTAVTKDQWESTLTLAREPFGEAITRKVKSSDYHTDLPGGPNGEYVIIEFETSFKNKESSIETVTPKKSEDGLWKIAGYYIR